MKAILLREPGGLGEVYFGDTERPDPSPGTVLVRTQAAALNHLDLFTIGGIPGLRLNLPHILGADGAGLVEEVGEGVSRFCPGEPVMLNPACWCGQCEFCRQGEESLCIRFGLVGEHLPGTFAEYFQVPEQNLQRIPKGISFGEAAAFSLVHQTAWRMLVTRAGLRPGEDVFVHGIGGGVSLAALQIAKLSGARVFVSSSSDEKLERAAELGADFGYNYRKTDIVEQVLSETGKRGVDVVVESVGKATWLQSLKIVRKGGRVVTCGATTGANPATEIRLIFWKQIQILGSTMSSQSEYSKVVDLLAKRRLQPVIDRVFPLSEGKAALKHLHSEQHFGKIVLSVPRDSR